MNLSGYHGIFVAASFVESLPTILAVTAILTLLVNAYLIFQYFRKKKRIGAMQLSAINSIIYTDFFSQLIIFMPFVMLLIFGAFSGDLSTLLSEMALQYIALPVAMLVYFGYCLLQAFCKKGFYDGGVMTNKGPLEYKDVTAYRLSIDHQAKKLKIMFNPRGKSGANSAYLVVEEELSDVIKAFLRKHCSLKAPSKKEAAAAASPSLFKRKKVAEETETKGIRPEKKPKKKKSKKK